MNLDDLKSAWQAQPAASLKAHAALLFNEVRRNERSFQCTLFWRDTREIGVALILLPFWLVKGHQLNLPWTWYLMVPAMVWVAGFIWVNRVRQRRHRLQPEDTLRQSVERSLAQVEHQIWLLRNVVWWYLLPIVVPMAIFLVQMGMEGGVWEGTAFPVTLVVVALITWGVWWLNRYAVRQELEPRRRELEDLRRSLGESGDESQPVPPGMSPQSPKGSSGRNALSLLCVLGTVVALSVWGLSDWLSFPGKASAAPSNAANDAVAGDYSVTTELRAIRQKHNLPAMAATVVTSVGAQQLGVVGVRKRETEVPVSAGDLWHLGSNGKAMTATLVAKLVEQGRLKWDTRMVEVFPELADTMHPKFKTVIVAQLLQHRGGLPANLTLKDYLGDDVRVLRARAVRDYLAKPPTQEPGAKHVYSNLGYIIAGAVVEKATGQTWERVITDELFTPLGMKTAGFGGTGTPGKIDQPWPHFASGKPAPNNGPKMDNPPVMGPAGRIHCTIQDWAKFIQDQLRGARGEPALLKPASYRALHTPPPGGDYAGGWVVLERDWGGGTVLHHGGDNTMNCANVWVAPRKNVALLICVNQSGNTAFRATDEVVGALMELHNQQRGKE